MEVVQNFIPEKLIKMKKKKNDKVTDSSVRLPEDSVCFATDDFDFLPGSGAYRPAWCNSKLEVRAWAWSSVEETEGLGKRDENG